MFSNIYHNKKVLITGNTGFKGSWLSIWLNQLGAKVYGISNEVPTVPSIFEELSLALFVEYKEIDIRNAKELAAAIADIAPDFLFHLAAQPIVGLSYEDPLGTIATNTQGTAHVLDAFRNLNNDCVGVFITSDKCYENVEWNYGYRETDHLGGKDIYSASKGACEIIIHGYFHSFIKHKKNLKMASTRAGNVIGGGDWADRRLVADCFRAWSKGESVEIRSPRSTRPWQHVLEPLGGYLRTGQALYEGKNINGEAYNFGPPSEHTHTVQEILEAIGSFWDKTSSKQLFTMAEAPGFHEAGLLKLNCDKAVADLQWRPALSFQQTARFTAEWYLNFYNKSVNMLPFTQQQIQEYFKIATEKGVLWTQ
ncbi:MAG: CDP-glucose 4,6-dehydratase [Imperialibacter sp.]|uniref:CDP-glucose 4,6-dehydratase n=1 Tax=Imperialibacter sp. TaxID=2038411 RepID=UPI0032EACD25